MMESNHGRERKKKNSRQTNEWHVIVNIKRLRWQTREKNKRYSKNWGKQQL